MWCRCRHGQQRQSFDFRTVKRNIKAGLESHGYKLGVEYEINAATANIVNISWGLGVGYTFTEHDLGKTVHDISATKSRAKMRERGELE